MSNQKSYYQVPISPSTYDRKQYDNDKSQYSKLYSSDKFYGKVSETNSTKDNDLSSKQIMNNLNLSFDGLFSKINALKQQHTVPKQSPKKISQATKYTWNKYLTPTVARTQIPKQISPFAEITGNFKSSRPISMFSQTPKQKSADMEKKQQSSTFRTGGFNGTGKDGLNSEINQQDNTKNAFAIKNLMKMPTQKASIIFGNDGFSTVYETKKSNFGKGDINVNNLNSVVERLAQQKSQKAIKQSIIINSQIFSKENQKKQIKNFTIQDFHMGKCVGSGKFGDVLICQHKETGFLFAIKKIFKSTILQYDMVKQFTRELKIHYTLDHPNIIKLYAHFEDEYHIFLLMQYAEGGILMDRLKCSEQITSRYVAQAVDAVQYLHRRHIAHRDIKPENIVLQFNEVIKLCDFGWSSFYDNQMKTTFCGTLDYMSPEMKDGEQYNNSVDIWSLGVLTFELLIGHAPYKKELNSWQRQGSRKTSKMNWNINYPPSISALSQSFMRNLLKQNPEDRSTLRICSSHMFIKKYQKDPELHHCYEQFSKLI